MLEISGKIKRVGASDAERKSVFLCDQLPLGGIGNNGVQAIWVFVECLLAYIAYARTWEDVLDKLIERGNGIGDGIRFSFGIPGHMVTGRVVPVNGREKMFVANCDELPLSGIGSGPLGSVCNFLDCLRVYESEARRTFGDAIRDHLDNPDNHAWFSTRFPYPDHSVLEEAEGWAKQWKKRPGQPLTAGSIRDPALASVDSNPSDISAPAG